MERKKLIIIQIILWVAVAIFLAGVLVVATISEGIETFNIGKGVVLGEVGQSISNLDISEKNKVVIDMIDEDVVVLETEDGRMTIEQRASGKLKEEDRIFIEEADGTLRIYKNTLSKLFNFGIMEKEEIVVYVPKVYTGELTIKTTSGDMHIDHSELKQVNTKTTSGNSVVENVWCDKLEAKSTSGEITLNNIGSNSIEVATTSGEIQLSEVRGMEVKIGSVSGEVNVEGNVQIIEAATTSGEIELDINEDAKKVKLGTVSGNIAIDLPEQKGFEVDFSSVSGDLNISGEEEIEKNGKYTYGDGSLKIKATSTSGEVEITFK